MITVWNRTKEQMSEHVGGQLILIAPGQCTQVTEKKFSALMQSVPEKLSLCAPGLYPADAEEALGRMGREQLLVLARKLVRGDYVRAEEFVVREELLPPPRGK